MGVSVYLSNGNMQIAVGNATKKQIKLQQLYHIQLKEGCLLNGVIITESDLVEELKCIWQKYQLPIKDVKLIVDSTQLFTKLVTIPSLNEKKSKEIIKKEFSEIEDQNNYIFDYRVLKEKNVPKGMSSVIAVAANRTFVDGYRKVFEAAGIEITGMDASLNGETKVLEYLSEIGDDTFIVANLDDNNLVCTLVVNGTVKYFNRARIFSERGTMDFAQEAAQRVNGILQFAAANYKDAEIQDVYLGGVQAEDYDNISESMEALSVSIVLPSGGDFCTLPSAENIFEECEFVEESNPLANYTYVIGELIRSKKDINLIGNITKTRDGAGLELGEFKMFLVPAAALLICALITGGLFFWNYRTESQIADIQEYLSSEDVQKQYQEASELDAKNSYKVQAKQDVENFTETLNSYPRANRAVEAAIRTCAGDKVSITVDQYGAQNGMYEFTAMAANVTDIHDFIDQLKATNLFGDLEYSGYNYTDETLQYDIQVHGYLNENAGK